MSTSPNHQDSPLTMGNITTDKPIELDTEQSLNIVSDQKDSHQSTLQSPQPNSQSPTNDQVETINHDAILDIISPTINDKNNDQMEIDFHGENSTTDLETDSILKIQEINVLSDLFTLLYDLQTGSKSVKDFDKYLSSVRLKLNKLKNYLTELDFINEDYQDSLKKNDILKVNNIDKINFLKTFKFNIENEIN